MFAQLIMNIFYDFNIVLFTLALCILHLKCFPVSALCCQAVIQKPLKYLLDYKYMLMAFAPCLNTSIHQELFHRRHRIRTMTVQPCQPDTWELPRRTVPPSSLAICPTCPALVSNPMILWSHEESVQIVHPVKMYPSKKMKKFWKELQVLCYRT